MNLWDLVKRWGEDYSDSGWCYPHLLHSRMLDELAQNDEVYL